MREPVRPATSACHIHVLPTPGSPSMRVNSPLGRRGQMTISTGSGIILSKLTLLNGKAFGVLSTPSYSLASSISLSLLSTGITSATSPCSCSRKCLAIKLIRAQASFWDTPSMARHILPTIQHPTPSGGRMPRDSHNSSHISLPKAASPAFGPRFHQGTSSTTFGSVACSNPLGGSQ